MIPTPRALAELALRRQEDLSRQLSKAYAGTGSSLLPDVLRRAIVTVSVCHESLRALEASMDSGIRPASHPFPRVGTGGGPDQPGRYGFVADMTAGTRLHQMPNGGKLGRAHLALAVDSALLAYGDLLSAADYRAQRAAVDSLLDYLESLDIEGGFDSASGQTPIAQGARRIRVVLDARRSSTDSSKALYRDLESFTVEGTVWSYCAALLADAFRRGAPAGVDLRAAVRRIDLLREGLEAPPPAPSAPPLAERVGQPGRAK